MPNGPWPNAPSDPCLPVSILVPRNALVLTIQFHLPDKSGYRTCEVAVYISDYRVIRPSGAVRRPLNFPQPRF